MYIEWDIEKVINMNRNVSSAIQLMLTDVWLLVQNTAKTNAPYLTWMLRKSINANFNYIQKWYAIVWSPLKYARRREFENNLHPDTKYYLMRWYTDNELKIWKIVKEALNQKLK